MINNQLRRAKNFLDLSCIPQEQYKTVADKKAPEELLDNWPKEGALVFD